MIANGVFGRENELAQLRETLVKRRSFLMHGPCGVGKTSLIRESLRDYPEALYCPDSSSKQSVWRALAAALMERSSGARQALQRPGGINGKSAVSLKGIVLDRLRAGKYWIVLDHLNMLSRTFAADVKEMAGWGMAPILAIARSDHMEDIGFLLSLFPDRRDKFQLAPLDDVIAQRFAEQVIKAAGIVAENLQEFIARVLDLGCGNPGVISSMVEMAKLSKYRSGAQIMVAPLYIDFRMNWRSASAR